MAHCAIYVKGSDEIRYFIRDCVQIGRDFKGSNGSVTGVKERLFDVVWTDDDVSVALAEEKAVEGNVDRKSHQKEILFTRKVSELTPARVYQGKVVSSRDDVNAVTRNLIAKIYSPTDEIKILREFIATGKDDELKAYQSAVEGLVKAGREFKEKEFR
jgi:hypothetical protein